MMRRIIAPLRWQGRETFSSLYVRNYRLYYIGQIISTSGTFMQSVAQAFHAKPCNEPSGVGLSLLAGDEDAWTALFP